MYLLLITVILNTAIANELNLPSPLYNVFLNTLGNTNIDESTEVPLLSKVTCFGFEDDCAFENTYANHIGAPECGRNEKAKVQFFDQGDFGYLKQRKPKKVVCSSTDKEKSELRCSEDLQYCIGRNIYFDFKDFGVAGSMRYRNDIIKEGDVGGNCDVFDSNTLKENLNQKSYLMSWGHELEYFHSDESFSMNQQHCDVIFDRTTVVMKQDASVNMYHHFCDYINLYASYHLNNSFNTDVDLVWWDTHSTGFVDQLFGVTWSAFTDRKPVELISLAGKRVCFRQIMLPLLARQPFGLYYNMPLAEGCRGSSLVHSFSHFILHRLGIEQKGPLLDKIRITVLNRNTQFRRINNLDEILAALGELPNVQINVVNYSAKMPFLDQLAISYNSDIFLGMHGAGLTHLLFLPDWASVFEIYNCEDWRCYYDLARLRGVKYFTWPKDKEHLVYPTDEGRSPVDGTAHKKFTNYSFDVDTFRNVVKKMIEFVRRHPKFQQEKRKLRRLAKARAEL